MEQQAYMDRLRDLTADLARAPSAAVACGSQFHQCEPWRARIAALGHRRTGAGLIAGLIAGIALFTTGISRRVAIAAAANADRLRQGMPCSPIAGQEMTRPPGEPARSARAEQLLDSRAADLITARDEAVPRTQAKNAFLSSTSHELRTPLNAILGFTQLLQMSELGRGGPGRACSGFSRPGAPARADQRATRHRQDRVGRPQPVGGTGRRAPVIVEALELMGPLATERSATSSTPPSAS